VTYREHTKIDWLGVSADAIAQFGVVSASVARQMACGVLERTVEADVAVSVTGHLGPDAPAELDGVVFIAVAWRDANATQQTLVWEHHLQSPNRFERQQEATTLLLDRAREWIAEQGRP
jgi:PncC family amidohydrolase